jgi:hypothetical protein
MTNCRVPLKYSTLKIILWWIKYWQNMLRTMPRECVNDVQIYIGVPISDLKFSQQWLLRLQFSGITCQVVWYIWTSVSEKASASIGRVDLFMTGVDSLEMLTSSKTKQWHNPNPYIHVSLIFNLGSLYKMDRQTLVDTFPLQNSLQGGHTSWPLFLNFTL